MNVCAGLTLIAPYPFPRNSGRNESCLSRRPPSKARFGSCRGASLNLLCPYSELTSTFLVQPLEHLSKHLSKVASHLEGQLYSYLQVPLRTLSCDSLESALHQPAPVSTTAEPLLGPQKQCIQPHRTSHTFPSEIAYFPSSQWLDNDLPTPAHRTCTSVYKPSSPPASVETQGNAAPRARP